MTAATIEPLRHPNPFDRKEEGLVIIDCPHISNKNEQARGNIQLSVPWCKQKAELSMEDRAKVNKLKTNATSVMI
ncbi:hypothetical protein T265_05505 [Opisthorchis viverrini]|uniref:Uncharacterized protein n=1 Tax=Opisthorchis viverrini TaxID=6198 RepID=A0A074ZK90_OPIVI|nr:hypothetical protein T265_05505 [Opisthorchis viverrini]KER27471.1 hypothetical protein T265_05505 [Opisthorchis viverrini]